MMQLHSWQRQNFDLEQLQLPVERKQLTTMGLNHAAVEHAQKMVQYTSYYSGTVSDNKLSLYFENILVQKKAYEEYHTPEILCM